MSAVRVEVRLTPREVSGVGIRLLLRNPASVMLIAAGPIFWLIGAMGGTAPMMRLGQTLSWLVVLVPAFALLVGTFSAHRPGSAALYAPVTWSFDEDGIDVEQPDRRARAEWGEFRSWRSAADCFLLYTARSRYVIVPRRAMSPGDAEALEALLRTHLGPRRR